MILSFLDVFADQKFRLFLNKRLQQYNKDYSIFKRTPILYRYRPLQKFVIDDICNNNIQLSSLFSFNDAWEGNMCIIKDEEYLQSHIKERIRKYEFAKQLGCPEYYPKDNIAESETRYLKRMQFQYSSMLANTGAYVGCFSENYSSSLMWSHYADSHKGICIEYDFTDIKADSALHRILFPVCYTSIPVEVGDLIEDKERNLCEYPTDAAFACALLNKSTSWQYENEWRIIMDLNISGINYIERWISIKELVQQDICCKSIILGYHFLQNLFYYKNQKSNDVEQHEKIQQFYALLNYLERSKTNLFYLMPSTGTFDFKKIKINPNQVITFLNRYFSESLFRPIDSYYTILSSWLERMYNIDSTLS